MRLSKVPLVVVQDHVINMNLLLNAYVDTYSSYPTKYGIRYFMDSATQPEDENGVPGSFIHFSSKKAAVAGLAALAAATDTLMVEEEE
jgi:hypothetical protein